MKRSAAELEKEIDIKRQEIEKLQDEKTLKLKEEAFTAAAVFLPNLKNIIVTNNVIEIYFNNKDYYLRVDLQKATRAFCENNTAGVASYLVVPAYFGEDNLTCMHMCDANKPEDYLIKMTDFIVAVYKAVITYMRKQKFNVIDIQRFSDAFLV